MPQGIREGRIAQLQVCPFVVSAVPAGPRHNLPVQPTPFVGREGALAQIAELLEDPTCRLLTVVGPGGSGKTHLALEAAGRQMDNFRHGVFFVPLAPLRSSQGIVPAVAQALGCPLVAASGTDPQRQLLDYLRGKHMLLLLDNFEHLLEGAGLVAQIVSAAPEVKVMITSRARLKVRGEHLLPILGMDVPPLEAEALLTATKRLPPEPQDVSRYSAVELFLRTARRVRPHLEPAPEELGQVAQVCRLVEGMPLAILLAAAWMRMLTPAEIAAHIADGQTLDFLEAGWRDVPPRQRSMRAVFDHSWGLLAPRQGEIFAGLSVFRGGFLHEAAQEVAGASLHDLMALVDRSLLQRTATGRYEVHELLRQYGGEKLALSPGAEKEVRGRHCAHYASALQRWEADLRGPKQKEALAEMEADIENGRAAWDWAVAGGDVARIAQAMDGLCRFYERRGRFPEGETACRAACDTLKEMEEELTNEELRVLAQALGWQGMFDRLLGRLDLAGQLVQQALSVLDSPPLAEQDTRSHRAFLLYQLGHSVRRSDVDRAKRWWEQSLALYRVLDERWGTASVLSDLGVMDLDQGEADHAMDRFQDSLALRRGLGDARGVADALVGLTYAGNLRGEFEEGERLAREALAICRDLGDRAGLADALRMLACQVTYQGRFTEAHRLWEQAVALREELGMRGELVVEKGTLAWTKANLGWYEAAYALKLEALALSRETGRAAGYGLLGLGEISLVQGAYVKARQWLQESAASAREIHSREILAKSLACLGHVERGEGRLAEAEQCLLEALRTIPGIDVSTSLHALSLATLLLADRGEAERAIEVYALAMRYPYAANSRFWEDLVGRHIAALAATLPPEVVAAAQRRGRDRDLDGTILELLKESERGPGGAA